MAGDGLEFKPEATQSLSNTLTITPHHFYYNVPSETVAKNQVKIKLTQISEIATLPNSHFAFLY